MSSCLALRSTSRACSDSVSCLGVIVRSGWSPVTSSGIGGCGRLATRMRTSGGGRRGSRAAMLGQR